MENNTKLIEQFSQLEKLCNDIYGGSHGVTLYIDEMKKYNSQGSRKVKQWESDLKKLIDVRHKRNRLSHGEASFDTPYATEDDILFIKNFRIRILKQSDPLSMFNKAYLPKRTVKGNKTLGEVRESLGIFLFTVFLILFVVLIAVAAANK